MAVPYDSFSTEEEALDRLKKLRDQKQQRGYDAWCNITPLKTSTFLMIDSTTLEAMSLAELKTLHTTIVKLIDSKTADLKKEILADAKQRATDNGIDPKTLFEEPKKRGRKSRTAST